MITMLDRSLVSLILKNMLDYFKMHPSRSHKLARLSLINQFYILRDFKAHKDVDNVIH